MSEDMNAEPKTIAEALAQIKEDYHASDDSDKDTEDTTPVVEPEVEETEPEDIPIVEDGEPESKPDESAYTPNHTYKAYGEEKEFDEWLKPLTTKENEDEIRTLLSKAYGLDETKDRLEKTKKDLADTELNYHTMKTGLDRFQGHVDKKNLREVFDTLKINDDDVFDYASKRLDYHQMEPTERTRIDQQHTDSKRSVDLDRQNQMVNQQLQEMATKQHNMEFDSALAGNKEVITDFDAKYGSGSFEQQVRDLAIAHWHNTKKDLTIVEAMETAKKRFGYEPGWEPSTAKVASKGKPKETITKKTDKATIPDAGKDSGATPVASKVKSIDDLQKLANAAKKEMKTGMGVGIYRG